MLESVWILITSRPVKIFSTVFVALLGIYGTFIYDKKPKVFFELTSNATVLDVREPLSKLTVIYDGTNLKEQNQNLFLLNIRVSNKGNADILKSSFDDGEPLGFKINSGSILEPPKIFGDEYLKNNLRPKIASGNTVTFSPVILNAGDAFEVKTLLSVKNGETPTITPIGKIAGIQNFQLSEPFREASSESLYYEAFHGNMKLQIVRSVFYSFFVIIFLLISGVLVIIPAIFISEMTAKISREQKAKKYRAAVNRRLSLGEEFLIAKYIENSSVFDSFVYLSNSETLNFSSAPSVIRLLGGDIERDYEELDNAGLIVRDGPQVSVNPAIEVQTKEFVNFVADKATNKQEI